MLQVAEHQIPNMEMDPSAAKIPPVKMGVEHPGGQDAAVWHCLVNGSKKDLEVMSFVRYN